MRDDCAATVDTGDHAEIDRERELDRLALAQGHFAGLDEHTGRAEVARAAQAAAMARHEHVYDGPRAMARR